MVLANQLAFEIFISLFTKMKRWRLVLNLFGGHLCFVRLRDEPEPVAGDRADAEGGHDDWKVLSGLHQLTQDVGVGAKRPVTFKCRPARRKQSTRCSKHKKALKYWSKYSNTWCFSVKITFWEEKSFKSSSLVVCPKPSIDYPGTRVFEGFSEHSGTRVVGSSTRVFKLKVVFYIYSTFSRVLKVEFEV